MAADPVSTKCGNERNIRMRFPGQRGLRLLQVDAPRLPELAATARASRGISAAITVRLLTVAPSICGSLRNIGSASSNPQRAAGSRPQRVPFRWAGEAQRSMLGTRMAVRLHASSLEICGSRRDRGSGPKPIAHRRRAICSRAAPRAARPVLAGPQRGGGMSIVVDVAWNHDRGRLCCRRGVRALQ